MDKSFFKRDYIWVLAAATLWGTTGTTQALAPSGATPLVIGALRMAAGGVVLLGIALWRGAFKEKSPWPIRLTLLATICMAAYQIFFFSGVARTGVAIGTIVGIGSCPISGGILGYFFRGERPGRTWLIATAMSIVGTGLLASSSGEVKLDMLGLLMAVLAGAAYAAFTLFSKGIFEKKSSEAALGVIFLLGTGLLSPVLFFSDLSWTLQPAAWIVIAHLGIVTVGLAYSFFARGLKTVSVSTTTTLTLAEPLTAGILGLTVLGEQLTLTTGLGILFIFGGMLILSLGNGQ